MSLVLLVHKRHVTGFPKYPHVGHPIGVLIHFNEIGHVCFRIRHKTMMVPGHFAERNGTKRNALCGYWNSIFPVHESPLSVVVEVLHGESRAGLGMSLPRWATSQRPQKYVPLANEPTLFIFSLGPTKSPTHSLVTAGMVMTDAQDVLAPSGWIAETNEAQRTAYKVPEFLRL